MSVRTRIKGKSLVVISDDGSHTNFNEEAPPRNDEIELSLKQILSFKMLDFNSKLAV